MGPFLKMPHSGTPDFDWAILEAPRVASAGNDNRLREDIPHSVNGQIGMRITSPSLKDGRTASGIFNQPNCTGTNNSASDLSCFFLRAE